MTRFQMLQSVGRAELGAGTRVRATVLSKRRCVVTVTGVVEAVGQRTMTLVSGDDSGTCRLRLDGRAFADVSVVTVHLSELERLEVLS